MLRVLLQTHSPTGGLAHLGTALAIAAELRRRGHRTTLAYGGTQPELIERAGLPHRRVAEVPPEREWTPQEWFRSAEELAPAVDSHLEAIAEVEPDLVIACHGVPGRVAAEIAGLPLLHVFHYLHGSRYARALSLGRDRRRDLAHPRRALRVGRARLRRLARGHSNAVGEAVRDLRAAHGLTPAPADAIAGCPDSLLALSTTPFLVPARGLPAHWRYVGPISWAPAEPLPPVPQGEGPLAYVTQGSTGEAELLERAVAELARDGFRVIATTAGLLDPERLVDSDGRVVAARLLDGRECLRLADVAVIHGGHQTLLDALRAATPVVALPSRVDQIGHVHQIEGLGIGRGLYPPPLLGGAVGRAARRVLRPGIRARVRALAAQIDERWDGVANTVALAERLAAGEEPARQGRP